MLSEITRVSCLASFGLSGRGQVYPGSFVGSASPMQMSRGPKVAGWAPCTLAYARKQRRWAEPILGAPCAGMESCVCSTPGTGDRGGISPQRCISLSRHCKKILEN